MDEYKVRVRSVKLKPDEEELHRLPLLLELGPKS